MSTVSGIRGAAAYVQAYLDDNPVTQGLAKLRGKIRSWQASLSTMAAGTMGGNLPEPLAAIARFATSPAGAFAGLLGAAHHTAAARDEMLRMSEATGVTVEKLSALAYAARRAGVSNEALASALKRMQGKEFMGAMQGAGKGGLRGATNAMFAEMGTGDAADRLREFIRLAENMPSEEKIGLARRMGLSEILPLINQGLAGLDAFTARAKELGLVMGEEDAKAGKRFGLAMGDLHDVLMSSVSAIGGALVPLISGLTNVIVRTVVGVRDWIKQHRGLTLGIFAVTGAIVGAGIAIKLLSMAFGVFGTVVTIVTGLVSVFNVLLAVTNALSGSLTLPFVLLGAALLALAGYLAYLTGDLGELITGLNEIGKNAGEAMGAIAHAIAGGQIEKAWQVVTSFMRYEWSKTVGKLAAEWEMFMALIHFDPGRAGGAMGSYMGEVLRLQKEYEQAKAAANAVKMPELGSHPEQRKALAAMAGEIRGTFSGAAAGMLGGGTGERQVQLAEEQVRLQAQQQYQMQEALRGLQALNETVKGINMIP
jgi:hypothetical protein